MATPQRVEFVYKLEGDVSEISVFELAPALLSLGHVIQAGNRILNPNGPDIAVHVRPFEQGSFLADIVLTPASAAVPLLAAIGPDPVQTISETLRVIGVIKGAATSALEIITKLRGAPDTVERPEPGQYVYKAGDVSVTTNGEVHSLLINPSFNQHFYGAYKPVEGEAVTDIKTYLRGAEETTAVVVDKPEMRAIREYAKDSASGAPADRAAADGEDLESAPLVFVKPRRGPFSGEKIRWSFTLGDAILKNVRIRDESFLEKVDRGEIRPNQTDLLRVRLLTKQKTSGTKLESSHEILEVVQYIKGGEEGEQSTFDSPATV